MTATAMTPKHASMKLAVGAYKVEAYWPAVYRFVAGRILRTRDSFLKCSAVIE